MLTSVRPPPRKIRLRALGAVIGGSLLAAILASIPIYLEHGLEAPALLGSAIERLLTENAAFAPLPRAGVTALAILASVLVAIILGGMVGILAGLKANRRMARLVDSGRLAVFALPVFLAAPLMVGWTEPDSASRYAISVVASFAITFALAASMAMNVALARRRALPDDGPILAGESAPRLRRKLLQREARRDYLLRAHRLFGWGVGLAPLSEQVFGVDGMGRAMMGAATNSDPIMLSATAILLGAVFIAGSAMVLLAHLFIAPGRATLSRHPTQGDRPRRRGDALRGFAVLGAFGLLTAAAYGAVFYVPKYLPDLVGFLPIAEAAGTTLLFALVALAAAGLVALVLALVLSVDTAFGRMIDAIAASAASAPPFLLAIIIAAILGECTVVLVAATTAILTPLLFFAIHRAVLRVSATGYVEAVRVSGAGEGAILFRHILPNIAATVATSLLALLPPALFAVAALDFAGLGGPDDPPTLGEIIARATGTGYADDTLIAAAALALLLCLAALATTRLSRRGKSPS